MRTRVTKSSFELVELINAGCVVMAVNGDDEGQADGGFSGSDADGKKIATITPVGCCGSGLKRQNAMKFKFAAASINSMPIKMKNGVTSAERGEQADGE